MTNIRAINEELINEIDNNISNASKYSNRIVCVSHEYIDEYDEYMAEKLLYRSWRQILALLETQKQLVLLEEAKKEYEIFKKDPLDSAMGIDEPYAIWPGKIREFLEVIRSLYIKPSKQGSKDFKHLKRILRNCELFVTSLNIFAWLPCDEADVHDRIERMLECFFSDLARKPAINKTIKNFIPDTGIKSLKTLIEYKYVKDQDDSKRVLDEIYTDINGYQADEYENIMFVIYETARCFSEQKWKDTINKLDTRMQLDLVLLKGTPPAQQDYEIKAINSNNLVDRKKQSKKKKNTRKKITKKV